MPSSNVTIKKREDWVEVVDAKLVSNGGSPECMFLTDPNKPSDSLRGHPLKKGEGFNVDDLPDERLWFKAVSDTVTLVVSV